jgi:hypothetical protein
MLRDRGEKRKKKLKKRKNNEELTGKKTPLKIL